MDGAELMTLHLGAAVAHISSIRSDLAQRTGCTEWDNGGIRAALIATEGAPSDVSAAACLAAGDESLKYPSRAALITHWPKNATAPARASNAMPCPTHPGHDEPCTHRDHLGDMSPEDIAAAAAECRRVAAQAKAAAEAKRAEIETKRQEATR